MARRVYAGNLNFDLTDAGLRAVFARVGFVDMMTGEDAEAAIGELNGTEVMGRPLRVAPAKPRENSSPQASSVESRSD
jgi:RNA recognition motif-containing protein